MSPSPPGTGTCSGTAGTGTQPSFWSAKGSEPPTSPTRRWWCREVSPSLPVWWGCWGGPGLFLGATGSSSAGSPGAPGLGCASPVPPILWGPCRRVQPVLPQRGRAVTTLSSSTPGLLGSRRTKEASPGGQDCERAGAGSQALAYVCWGPREMGRERSPVPETMGPNRPSPAPVLGTQPFALRDVPAWASADCDPVTS